MDLWIQPRGTELQYEELVLGVYFIPKTRKYLYVKPLVKQKACIILNWSHDSYNVT